MVTMEQALAAVRRRSCVKASESNLWGDLQAITGQDNTQRLVKQILGVGGAGLGVGLSVGGLYSLLQQAHRNLTKPVGSIVHPSTVDIVVPAEQQQQRHRKSAQEDGGGFWGTLRDFFGGKLARTPVGDPRWWVTVPAAGSVGVGGGLVLQKWLHEKRRKAELNKELDEAKKEYMQALSPKLAQKQGTLSHDLDQLCDEIEKKAGQTKQSQGGYGSPPSGFWNDPEFYGQVVGPLLLLSALTGGVGMFGGYQHGRQFQKRQLLEEAQQKRRRERYSRQPGAVLAQPLVKPVPLALYKGDPVQAAPSLDEIGDQLA